ncbi:MAG: hypothetical protein CBB87_10490 [Micavibrio sp. TMED27]|nr:restriction endonuclease subunit S [Micavibrio sp.]OUT90181.1 MAG: hypothetical protein CBB87_10490 [Micavibrio sp. TMED27]|tara:strand:- start:1046 stop:2185 length:1140 start_codon:yes stop_codon:yes gene_type:complete
MSWGQIAIEDIALVKGGKRLPKGHDFVSYPTPYPYIRARDIGQGKIEIKDYVYLSEETHEKIKRYIVNKGDVVITIVGANVGDVGYVQDNLDGANLTENAAKLVVDKSKIDPYFLKLYLSTEQNKKRLAFIASGAAQGKLGLYKIKTFPVSNPPLDAQKQIVQIVQTYDDLIENNKRRIELLEESARQLYKEWFVRFRFPGHEHVKIVDGVPEGWEKRKLKELLTLNYGKALKSDNRIPGDFPVYGSSGVVGSHNKALVKGPGIIVGRKGNVGAIYWSNLDFFPIDTVYFIKAEESSYFIYYALLHITFINTDVAVPGLNRDFAYSREVVVPNDTLREEFEDEVAPIFKQCHTLEKYNEQLSKARDLLLPKLMSGEVTV